MLSMSFQVTMTAQWRLHDGALFSTLCRLSTLTIRYYHMHFDIHIYIYLPAKAVLTSNVSKIHWTDLLPCRV